MRTKTLPTIGKGGQVVIPKKVRDKLGLKTGDSFDFSINKGNLVMEPVKLVEPDFTPEEEARILKGLAQLRRGEYVNLDELEREPER